MALIEWVRIWKESFVVYVKAIFKFYLCGCILLRYLRILCEHIIYTCNRQSQLFLFRLLPHYMFRPLRAIFR
jgi:hypothetical protein